MNRTLDKLLEISLFIESTELQPDHYDNNAPHSQLYHDQDSDEDEVKQLSQSPKRLALPNIALPTAKFTLLLLCY